MENIDKMSRRMTVQIQSYIFEPFEPTSIIWFLSNFKLACDTNGIHEGAAVWLFNFFIKKSVSTVLNTRLASKHTAHTRMPFTEKTTSIMTYPQVVNYLLRTYGKDENIAETEDGIIMLSQPPNKTGIGIYRGVGSKSTPIRRCLWVTWPE